MDGLTTALREFLASDALVALIGFGGLLAAFLGWRIWRSPNSWHIDGETKEVRFHGWLEVSIFGIIAFALLLLSAALL